MGYTSVHTCPSESARDASSLLGFQGLQTVNPWSPIRSREKPGRVRARGAELEERVSSLRREKWLREGQEQNNSVRRLRSVPVAARRASKAMAADVRAVFWDFFTH